MRSYKNKKMTTLSIVSLVLISLGGIGAVLLAISQFNEARQTKEEIIESTKAENLELKAELAELKRERDSLKIDLEQRDQEIRTQTTKLDAQSNRIIELQQQSIEENEYRNFAAGIVYDDSFVERAVREWFMRVKAAGINPPRYSRIIYVKLSHRTSSPIDYRIAPTRFSYDSGKVVIIPYRASVSIWRGLTHILLDKEIIELPDPNSYGAGPIPAEPDEMMYNGFYLEHYDTASDQKKNGYWSQMLDLSYPGYVN